MLRKVRRVRELWGKAVQGDKRAEEIIFSSLRERFTVIARLSVQSDDANDIAHEACLAVLKGYKTLKSPFKYSAWAQRVLKNKIAAFYQRKYIENETVTVKEQYNIENTYSHNNTDHELLITLQNCLKKLQNKYPRYVNVLSLIQIGYSADEIGSELNLTKNNIYVILSRGRKFLRDCIFNGEEFK